MIDRAARDAAARLTRQFRDGAITNDELEEDWPYDTQDRALTAVSTMLWRYYDDHRSHVLRLRDPETLADLSRYAAFLDTDLPYEWSQDRFDTDDSTSTAALIFGLLGRFFGRSAQKAPEPSQELDSAVWPFFRSEDVPAD